MAKKMKKDVDSFDFEIKKISIDFVKLNFFSFFKTKFVYLRLFLSSLLFPKF